MTRVQQLAAALADAMLAGEWEPAMMRRRCDQVIGRSPWWTRTLVQEAVRNYPRPPADRPREFAAWVLTSTALDRAQRARPPLPRLFNRLAEPTEMVRRPFLTPVLHHAGALAEHLGLTVAELDLLADSQHRARRAPSPRIAHYRYRWLPRASGARLLEAPKPRLAAVQRRILDELLAPIPVHPAAHGFVRGRSAITGAAVHSGSAVVITVDLEHFFPSITAGRVWGVLRAAGYPESVAHALTGLTTHASPVSVLRSMPPATDPSRDFRLRRGLAQPHLPQGAPSSPQLANLICFSLDRRLAAYAAAAGARYTRYADDLTFSGGPELARRSQRLLTAVAAIVTQEGFALNPAKTRERRQHQRQSVTGIVVNEHPNLARPEFDRLKAILHDCRRNGAEAANREHHPDFRQHLLGRISWAASLSPARGARLRAEFISSGGTTEPGTRGKAQVNPS